MTAAAAGMSPSFIFAMNAGMSMPTVKASRGFGLRFFQIKSQAHFVEVMRPCFRVLLP